MALLWVIFHSQNINPWRYQYMSAQVVILIAKLKILVIHQICIPPKIISGVLSHIVFVHHSVSIH